MEALESNKYITNRGLLGRPRTSNARKLRRAKDPEIQARARE